MKKIFEISHCEARKEVASQWYLDKNLYSFLDTSEPEKKGEIPRCPPNHIWLERSHTNISDHPDCEYFYCLSLMLLSTLLFQQFIKKIFQKAFSQLFYRFCKNQRKCARVELKASMFCLNFRALFSLTNKLPIRPTSLRCRNISYFCQRIC